MSIELLRRLLEVTTSPPPDADVDTLLARFADVFEARQQLLATIGPATDDTSLARALRDELATRDAAWAKALASALDDVGAARQNASRLRKYAR